MSTGGHHYYFGDGDHVNMNGGAGNIGIDKRVQPSPDLPLSAQNALRELLILVQELRAQIPAVSANVLDEQLTAIQAEAVVPPQERHRALLAVAGIAATTGTLGVPVVEAVNTVLGLLGAT